LNSRRRSVLMDSGLLEMTKSKISTSELKAHASEVIDTVARTKTSVIITKRGRSIAKLVPIEDEALSSLFGFAKGAISIHGDIVGPLDVIWEAGE
jgi:prevent-host-death family protein